MGVLIAAEAAVKELEQEDSVSSLQTLLIVYFLFSVEVYTYLNKIELFLYTVWWRDDGRSLSGDDQPNLLTMIYNTITITVPYV